VMIIVGFSFREMICELIIDFLAIQRPLSVFEFRIGCCCGRGRGFRGITVHLRRSSVKIFIWAFGVDWLKP
jgi:hypothetical protein